VADPRKVALDALVRIEEQDAYANLALGAILERSKLDARDRGFVTELVYGVTRMRRACDFLVDRFTLRPLDVPTRNLLRLGAYQLHFLRTPPHAAVSATVEIAPGKTRGIANAILRRVADNPVEWPDDATRLSYPDWLVARLTEDLGAQDAIAALEAMDEAPDVDERADGYVQDRASQWVAEAVGAQPGERIADVCAAPGGKATALATAGAQVVAADVGRAGLVRTNVDRLGSDVLVLTADARWRVDADAVDRLAALQREILEGAIPLVKPGGTLVYSVCTLTSAETLRVDEWLVEAHPELRPLDPPDGPWRPHGRGSLLLPQAAGTDGMALFRFQVLPSGGHGG
jgi:16S rRNA (cytosine967-C5)-methyltransferase